MRTAQDIRKWAVIVKFGTRRQARMLKMTLRDYGVLYGLDHVRVIRLPLREYGVLYGLDHAQVIRLRPAARSKTLRDCADIVRKHYPVVPTAKEAAK